MSFFNKLEEAGCISSSGAMHLGRFDLPVRNSMIVMETKIEKRYEFSK